MTNANDVRRAHDLLDGISIGHQPNEDDLNHLRSFLPELPKQKALEEIAQDVYKVWTGTYGNHWEEDLFGVLEVWLRELHQQLQGLKNSAAPAAPAHPEFLETEADYQDAPEGTIVVSDDEIPWRKDESAWLSVTYIGIKDDKGMSRACRRVLRWGDGE